MKKEYIYVIIFLAALYGVKTFFWSSDKIKIARTINAIELTLEFKKKLSPLSIAGKIKSLKKHTAKDIRIVTVSGNRTYSESGFESIKSAALMGSKMIHKNQFTRTNTKLSVDKERASFYFDIVSDGEDNSQIQFRELFQVEGRMRKVDNEWIVTSISVERLTPEE